ncbi:MAG: DPP IV N-terminal domain-containing protein, partial [Bacteroidales bacterium]|nr:DPP IV N-terminal domain-containing protein [Bacteroidales bacterium]
MRSTLFTIVMASLSMISSAQNNRMTMEQLTPGHPDFVSVKALQQVKWNDAGELEYKTPAQVEAEKKANAGARKADANKNVSKKAEILKAWSETLPKQEGIVYGESVHRNEFGISGGIFWSADESQFAFYRMDESMVEKYPLVQTDPQVAEVKWVRYPMAGRKSHEVTLGIYNPATKQTLYLKTNEKPAESEGAKRGLNDPEHYLTNISWRPDGKQIFIFELNRLQNYMELNVYSTETGDFLYTLYNQEHEKYVEPENPLYFLPGSNDKFIMQNESTGYNQLWLCQIKEKHVKKGNHSYDTVSLDRELLTSGDWMVTHLIGVDPQGKAAYFYATKDSPLENNAYKVALPKSVKAGRVNKNNVVRLTQESGRHTVIFNKDYTQFYDTYTNHTTPRICQKVDAKTGKREVLFEAENPFAQYARPEVEVSTLKAADGETDLYYRLVKPLDFDPSKKYPVIVYLYNGPHTQLVTDGFEWGLPGWDAYMAQQGFVVFTIDGRGSSNRGLEFEQTIWHNLGYNEGKDQMQGVAYLKSLPWVDADRIGIYGWSYGGFMTTYMMINYPETFKVGVCGGPVMDWSRYEVMYGERYMGTPQNNAEGYARNCMVEHAGQLKGRLLVIHDDQDDTVVPQMSVQFLRKSVETGTYPDFMLYANHPHN